MSAVGANLVSGDQRADIWYPENPFTAAQRFLERNNLPMSYLDQVAEFITKNTQGAQLGGGGGYVDPYTGAARYTPSSSSVPTGGSQYQDPYTGASRYSGAGSPSSPTSGSYRDPFTGGTRYLPGGSSPQVPRVPQLLPVVSQPFIRGNRYLSLLCSAHPFRSRLRMSLG